MFILQVLKSIGIILEVLVIFNLMIIVHELGHFLAARWRGLVVEKFGIWFGKPLWKKTINGVEYSLGSIPAGGFVALPQLAPMEVMEGKVETPREQLPPISVLDKIIVAFAGPLFSFLLAVVFAFIVWQVGRPMTQAESTQFIGFFQDESPAEQAGLQAGDKIISVDGHPVSRFVGMSSDSIQWNVVRSEGDQIEFVVDRNEAGQTVQKSIAVTPHIPEKVNWWNRGNLRSVGIAPATDSLIAEVTPDTPAARAGLQKDDEVLQIDGEHLYSPQNIYDYIKDHPKGPYKLTVKRNGAILPEPLIYDPIGVKVSGINEDSPASSAGLKEGDIIDRMDDEPTRAIIQLIDYVGSRADVPIKLHIRRPSVLPTKSTRLIRLVNWVRELFVKPPPPEPVTYSEMDITVTPKIPVTNDPELKKLAKIGFVPGQTDGWAFEDMGKPMPPSHPDPIEQVRMSVAAIVNTIDAVASRRSSIGLQQMGGPVMMMNAYYHMLSSPRGIQMAIWFSVVLNVNLALLNLLPIPVLDGGHITLAIIEAIRRRPINVRILEYVQTACALVIISFMLFIMFFDVQDLPIIGEKLGGKRPAYHFPKAGETGPK